MSVGKCTLTFLFSALYFFDHVINRECFVCIESSQTCFDIFTILELVSIFLKLGQVEAHNGFETQMVAKDLWELQLEGKINQIYVF